MAHRPFTGRTVDTPLRQTDDNNYLMSQSRRVIREAGVETFSLSDVWTIIPDSTLMERRSLSPESYASLVHQGRFQVYNPDPQEGVWIQAYKNLELKDLEDPVPAAMYYDARRDDC